MSADDKKDDASTPPRLWSDGLPRWLGARVFNRIMGALAFLIAICALIAAGGALPSSHPLPLLTCVAMSFPAVAVHEVGHALAARLHGMRVLEIHVGFLNIIPLRKGLRWRLASPPKGVLGLVNAIPDPERSLKPAMLWLMVGGPLANLVMALMCLPFAIWGSSPWSEYVTAFLLINVAGFLINVLPFNGRHHASDGWQWLQWRCVCSEGQRELSVLKLMSLSVWGVTADRMPEALLRQIESLGHGGALLVAWVRLKASQNLGEWVVVEEVERETTKMLGQISREERSGLKGILAWLQVESAFSQAVVQRDVRALLALPLGREMRWRAPHLEYRFAALACALAGDLPACEAMLVRAQSAARRSQELALDESEARLAEHIRALAHSVVAARQSGVPATARSSARLA